MPLTRFLPNAHTDFVLALEPGTIAAVLTLIVHRVGHGEWGRGSTKTRQTD